MTTWDAAQAAAKAVMDGVDAALAGKDLEITNLLTDVGNLQTQVSLLQGALDAATSDDVSDDQAIATLTAQVSALSGQVAQVTASLATANGTIVAQTGTITALQTEVARLQALLDAQGTAVMRLGNGWGISESQYNAERDLRGFRMNMNYRPLEPRFSDVAAIPPGDTIWLQWKGTTKESIQAVIDSIPTERAADVVFYPYNEAAAKITLAQFMQYMKWSREVIDASGKPVRLGNQQSDWILFPAANVDEDAWFTGYEDVMGWSGFANAKVKDGHTVAALEATPLMDFVDAYSQKHDIPYAFATWGFPLIADTTQSRVNRLAWTQATYARMMASGCEVGAWYDGIWTTPTGLVLDYRLVADTTHLLPWWNSIKANHI